MCVYHFPSEIRIIVFAVVLALVLALLVKLRLKCAEYEIEWFGDVHAHYNEVSRRVEYYRPSLRKEITTACENKNVTSLSIFQYTATKTANETSAIVKARGDGDEEASQASQTKF